jgi:hypothetical protein
VSTEGTPRGPGGWFLPGQSPNPGGKPKKMREIEAMIDSEFRTVDEVRQGYLVLRDHAFLGFKNPVYSPQGKVIGEKTTHVPAYLEMWFNRIVGPVKELDLDFSDADPAFLDYMRDKLKLRQ